VGILKTAATVAVASSVHGRIQRRQQARWAAQDQASAAPMPAPQAPVAPAPPPQAPAPQAPAPQAPAPQAPAPQAPAPPPDMGERLAQLAQLGELMKAGILTEAEFEQQKARILNG
jgi:Short C-terminal domain